MSYIYKTMYNVYIIRHYYIILIVYIDIAATVTVHDSLVVV